MSTLPTPRPSLEVPVTSTRPPCSSTPTICPQRVVLRSPPAFHPPGKVAGGADGDPETAGEEEDLPACGAGEQAAEALRTAQQVPRRSHARGAGRIGMLRVPL